MKSVVVTGVSSGIGWGAAKVLTKAGYRVFGSVRKAADAERLSAEFGPSFVPLIFDVTDEAAVAAAAARVREAIGGETLFGLVNNAGVAVPGPLLDLPIDEFRQQIEVNLTGLVIATQAFGPLLIPSDERKGAPGRIVNISSVGGRTGTPFLGAYNASKFAVEGLSESLRREMMMFGVEVIVIAPGAVATQMMAKGVETDLSGYANSPFGPALYRLRDMFAALGAGGFPPEVLGEAILKALTTPSPRVRYTVTPTPMRNLMAEVLPKRFLDRAMARQLGLLPKG
ncbi:MAG TPA: SDR family NAD(P)-dependent oxidoreductase [Caulobacteraceae bacterium]|nr:SDR family NAD(P)-dependent oxidoreductase [Caulobacteraceae bacterium]